MTQANVGQTVCVRGYTTAVRPPASYTGCIKTERLQAYGLDPGQRSAYELDHLIPLEIGDAPDDIANVFPQPIEAARRKDRLEDALHQLVCEGRLPLAQAQHDIAANWLVAYRVYIGDTP